MCRPRLCRPCCRDRAGPRAGALPHRPRHPSPTSAGSVHARGRSRYDSAIVGEEGVARLISFDLIGGGRLVVDGAGFKLLDPDLDKVARQRHADGRVFAYQSARRRSGSPIGSHRSEIVGREPRSRYVVHSAASRLLADNIGVGSDAISSAIRTWAGAGGGAGSNNNAIAFDRDTVKNQPAGTRLAGRNHFVIVLIPSGNQHGPLQRN